ncbi:MAG: hypothetical protein Fur0016_31160 [Anaerolineales bacterium]
MTLYLLTAPSGAGKTTFCAALAEQARAAGWDVAGVLSPPVFENGEKTGILVQNLRTRETRPLAIVNTLSPHHASHLTPHELRITNYELHLGNWLFSPSALAWGNEILAASLPADLFLVDELGPLELIRNEGWTNALPALRQTTYKIAIAVVRPSLLATAQEIFPKAQVLPLPQSLTGLKPPAHLMEALRAGAASPHQETSTH